MIATNISAANITATKMMIATRFIPSPVEQSYRSTYAPFDRTNGLQDALRQTKKPELYCDRSVVGHSQLLHSEV